MAYCSSKFPKFFIFRKVGYDDFPICTQWMNFTHTLLLHFNSFAQHFPTKFKKLAFSVQVNPIKIELFHLILLSKSLSLANITLSLSLIVQFNFLIVCSPLLKESCFVPRVDILISNNLLGASIN